MDAHSEHKKGDGRTPWFSKPQVEGLAILAKGGQIKRSALGFRVRSQSTKTWYEIVWDGRRWSCECRFNMKTRRTCKHIYAIMFIHKLNMNVATTEITMECPSCGLRGEHIVKHGTYRNKSGLVQRLLCKRCGCRFTDQTCFEKMRHNGNIVVAAMDLYFKGLSYRKIAEHLRDTCGVSLTHVAVYNWIRKYLAVIRHYTSRVVPRVGGKWHCDEMQYRVSEDRAYVWNLMDAKTRFLLACRVTKRRRKSEAKRTLLDGIECGRKKPGVFVTDGLKSYAGAAQSLLKDDVHRQHVSRPGHNNRCERLNQTLRERTKTMRVKKLKSLSKFTADYSAYYNFLRPHSALKNNTPAQAAKIASGKGWFPIIRRASLRRTKRKSRGRDKVRARVLQVNS